MKILFAITGLSHGGAELQLVELARRLARRGHRVVVASLHPLEGHAAELAAGGIPVVSLGARGAADLPRAALALGRLLRRLRPDVLHGFMVHANLLTRVARGPAARPVLVNSAFSMRESRSAQDSAWLRERAYRWTDWLCDATTQVSAACAERYAAIGAVPRAKLRTIPGGVDVRRFGVLDADARAAARAELGPGAGFRWLAVGRLVDHKDYPAAVRALAAVAADDGACHLYLRGDGPEEATIRRAIAEHGVASQVTLLRERRDIPRLMNAVDALLISSVNEGLPTVALEAAACGLPVVATDVGGNREAVRHGVTGLVVPPRDPAALAAALREVMAMAPARRRAMGLAGRRHVEQNHDFEVVTGQFEALYRELLAAGAARVQA